MGGTRLEIVLSFVVFALVAAPFAWQLTQVERVPLPVERIQRLSWNSSRFAEPETFSIVIYTIDDDGPGYQHQHQIKKRIVSSASHIHYSTEHINLTEEQKQRLQHAKSAQETDDLLKDVGESQRHFRVFLLCDEQANQSPGQHGLVVGKYNHAWSIACSISPGDLLYQALEELTQQHLFPLTASIQQLSTKKARTALRYRLQFTLLKEQPEQQWRWDFPVQFAMYLSPFLHKISVAAHFTHEVQTVHYARLAKEIHACPDDKCFYVNVQDLTQFKTANNFLTSSVLGDREQVLHFMAALPNDTHAPLGIMGDQNNPRLASSFEIPGWGGVVILNPHQLRLQEQKEMRRVMGLFLTQLRTLLGVPSAYHRQKAQRKNILVFLPAPVDGITDWEVDTIVRELFKRHTKMTIETLQSIVQLVTEMPQMSVLGRVERRITSAVSLMEEILCSNIGDDQAEQCSADPDLRALLVKAREAAEHADAAYYDHTMIRQLYFPQEQMLGVYAPLLAPLILPFFVGLSREFKRWKTKRAAKQNKAH